MELPQITRQQNKRRLKPITANLADTHYEVVEQVCWELNYNLAYDRTDPKNWDLKWHDGVVSV